MILNLIKHLKICEQINYYFLTHTYTLSRLDLIVKIFAPSKITKNSVTSTGKSGREEQSNNSKNYTNTGNNQ